MIGRHIRCLLIALLGLSVGLMGCGEDRAPTRGAGPRTAGPAKKKKKKKKRKKKGKQKAASTGPRLRATDWDKEDDLTRTNVESRDPFVVFMEEEERKPAETLKPVIEVEGALGDYTVGQLDLAAIITGTAIHKALMVDPTGEGHVLRRGDIISRADPMRVIRISNNEVVFKPLQPPTPGTAPDFVIKRLWTEQELDAFMR